VHLRCVFKKNRTTTINIATLHQYTTFTNYCWHRDTLFNSPLTLIKFLNWLRTSCEVSITTAATLHIWTADFCTDFEQRIIDGAINERQNDCGAVSMPKDSIWTHNFWCRKTFYYSDRNHCLFKRFNFSVHKAAETVDWCTVKDCCGITRFSWYFAANTTVF